MRIRFPRPARPHRGASRHTVPHPARQEGAGRVLTAAVLAVALAAGLALVVGACSEAAPKVKTPPRIPYYKGQSLKDQGLYSEAITEFQKVIDENPGTVLGTYSYLQQAEIYLDQGEWVKSETAFRQFLAANPQSHLTPYVLYQLAKLNHLASYTGLFFPEREYDRDMQPNRQIVQEYKRFFFLYPNSIYRDDVRSYADAARKTLADNERMVGDFYFDRELYNSAAHRYLYLLRTYPDYPQREAVYKRLLEAFRRNQQPELADELERASAAAAAAPAKPRAKPGPDEPPGAVRGAPPAPAAVPPSRGAGANPG